jgi:ABC-2 type transport system permease protein
LRRFRATPLHPSVVLGSQISVNLFLAGIGAILTIVVARLLFNLKLPEEPAAVALAFALGCLSFFALSFIIAGLARTADAARSIGMALFFPMMMLSGAALPRALMPETVQRISEFLPMTQVVILMQSLWFGGGWIVVSVVMLIGLMIFGAAISTRTFRWE